MKTFKRYVDRIKERYFDLAPDYRICKLVYVDSFITDPNEVITM